MTYLLEIEVAPLKDASRLCASLAELASYAPVWWYWSDEIPAQKLSSAPTLFMLTQRRTLLTSKRLASVVRVRD